MRVKKVTEGSNTGMRYTSTHNKCLCKHLFA